MMWAEYLKSEENRDCALEFIRQSFLQRGASCFFATQTVGISAIKK